MANTYLDLLTAIADESRRPLASYRTQIEQCVKDAIAQCETETYWFNDADGLTFPTVAAQENYDSSDLSTIASITEFHDVSITIGSGDVRELIKTSWDEIEALNNDGVSTGQPTRYAYAFKQIRLYQIPNDVWTITMAAAYVLDDPADGDTTCWTTIKEGGLLVRYRASALFYGTYLRIADRASTFENLAQREVARLTASTSRRQATGAIRPRL